MAAVSLAGLIPAIDFSTTTLSVLAVASVLVLLYVTINAARFVIGMVRGQVYYGGRYWDRDIYETALRDVKTSMSSRQLVDRESRDAVARYEGSESSFKKSSRSSNTRIPRC